MKDTVQPLKGGERESERARDLKVGKEGWLFLCQCDQHSRDLCGGHTESRDSRAPGGFFTSCEELPDALIQGCDIASSNLLMQKGYLTKRLDSFFLQELELPVCFPKNFLMLLSHLRTCVFLAMTFTILHEMGPKLIICDSMQPEF